MEINQAWIDQQRAVCEAATPGPWEWDTCLLVSMNPLVAGCVLKPYYYNDDDEVTISITPGDAKLIAVASTALPAALEALESSMQRESEKDAEIARLTAERDAAVDSIRDVCNHCGFHGNDTDMECREMGCQFLGWSKSCAENAPEVSE